MDLSPGTWTSPSTRSAGATRSWVTRRPPCLDADHGAQELPGGGDGVIGIRADGVEQGGADDGCLGVPTQRGEVVMRREAEAEGAR